MKQNYANPPIPKGYKYVEGSWNNGFVIERKSDQSQFVWVPVESLPESNIEAVLYNTNMYYESESMEKYGGFYISRFNISKSIEWKPQSKRGKYPWTFITFDNAKTIANSMENNQYVESHLPYNIEYDFILEWLLFTHTVSNAEIYEDSSNLGNYRKSFTRLGTISKTGSCEKWQLNGIYDLAGNIAEWADFNYWGMFHRIVRGGSCAKYGYDATLYHRKYVSPFDDLYIGFRVVLDIN